jgi:menaquinone-dependent protoporphyrinogen oxidase
LPDACDRSSPDSGDATRRNEGAARRRRGSRPPGQEASGSGRGNFADAAEKLPRSTLLSREIAPFQAIAAGWAGTGHAHEVIAAAATVLPADHSGLEDAMSRVLVLYGTTQGQAGRIAETLASVLRGRGETVDLVNAASAPPDPAPFDAIVVAASVHAGGYQRAVRKWVAAHAPVLRQKPGAFISVCLGILQHEEQVQNEVAATVSTFLEKAGWQPTMTTIVAGALPYTKYNVLTRWIMKRIVAKAGGNIDTSRDYEYTDWAAVRAFADRFGELIEAGHLVAAAG